ncbi:Lrp/AsnC family transcriptional regulator [Roseibium marinum]|uniref:Lrp/AsnC family leucine-responsive transcriptional regulator n=1 Tax=Roseibium marinum TaxID=281252 RepID=A0A2S3V4H9_9HYPH|nr:Lrp/AsnC family transcriptional regulator [Roseibium marinum]POF34892.1 Lrp/AsnC family leucine-responsive transcriptional regulator [Roseibium marinum]
MDHLDEFDRHLLNLLSIDSRQTGKQLAEKIGLSPAACLRRVQRLRDIGAIEKEVAIVSPKVTGGLVTLLVMLELARGQPDLTDGLRRKLLKLPQVKKIYHVTGNADFVMILECASMEAYANLTEAHFYVDEIKGFDTIVVLRSYDPEPG